ncbi:MAG: hypothetical protein IJJ48_00230, partial [Firmicutes bacterium]|nr:hypothetical protein [Bacillota bacterium]
PLTILMMAGLQGSGKTTTTGKLALLLRKKYGLKPLMVAFTLKYTFAPSCGYM